MPGLPHPSHESNWDTDNLRNLLLTQHCLSLAGQIKDIQSTFLHPGTILINDNVDWGLESEG